MAAPTFRFVMDLCLHLHWNTCIWAKQEPKHGLSKMPRVKNWLRNYCSNSGAETGHSFWVIPSKE